MIKKLLCSIFFYIITYSATAFAVVNIGTLQFDPPFVTNGQHLVAAGFDIELMTNICNRLDWECKFIAFKDYDTLLTELINNNIDYAVSGIVITPLDNPNLLFSMPYLLSAGTFVTLKSNTKLIDLSSLANKKVGVLAGRGYGTYLMQNATFNMTIAEYHDQMELFDALYNGKVDAIFMNNYTAMYLMHRYPDYIKLINTSINFASGIGILSRVDNKNNLDKINALLTQFESDGTFVKLYNYHFAFFIK
ncbi:arginine ABC transporter substrate-binding protein [Legionella busanensis]|uniref:Arginine ABC transporter substrate-binding protein n=1 Tax=Legionella busanensis TaxID=190655 RepID=A0A378JPL4_9GAMM|nr:transporter substrate-binding domain-containing protein [Legionella busanensis]STX51900.1 arginine ABC transporter substrate-binding protein [Legionella busanensis]